MLVKHCFLSQTLGKLTCVSWLIIKYLYIHMIDLHQSKYYR